MSHIAIAKIHHPEREEPSLLEEMKTWAERVRERAFAIFQRRGSGDGMDVDDWLRAERDLMLAAESELIEKDSQFQLRIAAPGFDEKDVRVTALPDALVVSAESTHRHEKNEGNVHFCEFGEKRLFRRFDLPETIDVDKVAAQLDKGILRVTAAKARQAKAASGV
jgi:HSP20 family protein